MKSFSIGACIALLATVGGCGAGDVDGRGGMIAVGGTAQGTLSMADPAIAVPGRSGTMFSADLWTISLTMGTPVTIAMCENAGSDFDPYLSVADAMGMDSHTNDDSGGGFHGHGSLLTFMPTATGTYTIYASTFRATTGDTHGDYTLQVLAGDMTSTFHCPM